MSPLEVPLEVRKGMEIARRQVRAVGRMGENLKLQRLPELQLLREQCAVFSRLVNDFGRPVAGLIRSIGASIRVTYRILIKLMRLQKFYTCCSLLFRP